MVSVLAGTSAEGEIADERCHGYAIAIVGVPAILVSAAGNGWMRGVQDTVRPLRYVVFGFAVSAVLCPLLVYGWLGMPRLGLAGLGGGQPGRAVGGRGAVPAARC